MPRRNVFGDNPPKQEIPPVQPNQDLFVPVQETAIQSAPPSPISMIPMAESIHEIRNRDWDKNHPARRFRKVDPQFIDAVRQIANQFSLPDSEIARALLEVGLDYYQQGKLKIAPNLEESHWTIYPHGQAPGWKYTTNNVGNSSAPIKKKRKDKKEKRDWETGITYRFPEELLQEITSLRLSLHVPVGEVITVLGRTGLDVYNRGELNFDPQLKGSKNTIL